MEAQSLSTCNQCGKKFQRRAHLLRHQQQHSGDRPYSCKFCSKTFKRSDVLRDHFSRCDRRGTSAIPNSLDRGRKRHACDECSRLKVKCDNNVPCRKCKEFGRACVKTRPTGVSSPDPAATSPSVSTSAPVTPSDRNSIGFLLNCPGETDFMREFPKSTTWSPNHPAAEISNLMTIGSHYDPMGGDLTAPVGPYQQFGHMMHENNLDVFLSNLEFQTTFEQQTHNWQQMTNDNIIPWSGSDALFLDKRVLEQKAFDIREKLKYTAATQYSPHGPSQELLNALNIFTADNIVIYVKLYFGHWHKHGPMVHEPTFNPCTAALPLLLALMGLGGMYSKQAEDVAKLKLLLDTIEAFIYSLPGISPEYDLPGRVYVRHGKDGSPEWQQFALEELQGAYLFVVLQYWTGSDIARTRVRQERFARIISLFHLMELQCVQHPLGFVIDDQESFNTWTRTEARIRTATLASMLDNAFGIFNNVSPRLQWAEIDFTFPSDDRYFRYRNYEEMVSHSVHPVPKMKIKDAFHLLFSPPSQAEEDLKALRTGNLAALDMQMLIHYLYTHIWSTLFNSPLLHLPSSEASSIATTTIEHLRNAMGNWKRVWDELRAGSEESEWQKLGFQRTAEQYYGAVKSIVDVWEKRGGKFPPIPSDCEKGIHLKRILSF